METKCIDENAFDLRPLRSPDAPPVQRFLSLAGQIERSAACGRPIGQSRTGIPALIHHG